MSQSIYELIALGARYVFAALMVLIVARAWRLTIVDGRRAQTLRHYSPETGISGELIVMDGDEQARRGMKYPVIREGLIGSSARADIRIRHSSVRRRHAYFQLMPEGLSIRAHAGAPLRDRRGRPARALMLKDGDALAIGRVRLMLVLSESTEEKRPGAPQPTRPHRVNRPEPEFDDDLFETDPDKLFETHPVLNRNRQARPDDEEF